jgi:hypothetical protein
MDGFRRMALHNFRRAIGKEPISIKEIAECYNQHILPFLRDVSPMPMRAADFERVGYVPTSMLDEYMEEIFIQFFYKCARKCFGGGIFGMDEFRMMCTLVKTFNRIMDPDGEASAR